MEMDTIICGDNAAVMATWPDACIDLVVTSPPYDDLRKYGGHKWDFDALRREITRTLKPGGVCVWVVADTSKNHSESLTSFRQAIAFAEGGLNLLDTMIYRKSGYEFPRFGHRLYPQVFEFMFVLAKGAPATFAPLMDKPNVRAGSVPGRTNRIRNPDGTSKPSMKPGQQVAEVGMRGNVWEYACGYGNSSPDACAFDHPAIFPEGLARDHILSWSNPGDVVLDPFAGSGTTLKMAKEHGRRWIGIEVHPPYVEICWKRVAQGVLPLVPNISIRAIEEQSNATHGGTRHEQG